MKLYSRYISKFKGIDSHLNDNSLIPYYDWYKLNISSSLNDLSFNSKILELGCGPGYLIKYLNKNKFTDVMGIDISDEQIELANKRVCNAKVADVFEFLKNKNNVFDSIIAIDFIEHFHKEELFQLTNLIFNSLKQNGRLILKTPNGQGLFHRQIIYGDLTHLTIFTPSSLRQLLKISGFENIQFKESDLVRRTRGKLLWKFVKLVANTIRRIESGKSQTIWTENMICCCEKLNPRIPM